MRRLLSLMREVVWLSVAAVVSGTASVIAAAAGAGPQLVYSSAALGVTLAVLSTKQ